jgi:L1 cell adhesion molecule like protein
VEFQGKTTEYLPERVCSYLFKKLKIFAEGMAGGAVKFAVLTVPSGFSDSQRDALKAAGKMAGLQILQVINESAAAALTYDFDVPRNDGEGERVAIIVDVGSTSCDATVYAVEDGLLQCLANVRDETCGGSKLDANLNAHLADCFKRNTKVSGIEESHRAMARLRSSAETLKKSLSLNSTASIELDGLFEGLDLRCVCVCVSFCSHY